MMTYLNFPKSREIYYAIARSVSGFVSKITASPLWLYFYFLLGAASIALIVYLTLVSTRVEIQNIPYFHSYSSITNHEGTI